MSAPRTDMQALRTLARSYGVQLSFRDGTGKLRRARPEALLAVTKALGAGIEHVRDAPDVLRERTGQIGVPEASRVLVAWDGVLPASIPAGRTLRLEDGTEVASSQSERLPLGYHQMEADVGLDMLVISAPARAPEPPRGSWGIFLPLYALCTDRGWGTGDLTDLENVMRWTTKLGGNVVATLPLQATYLSGPVIDHSPYAPASRLFYNELYVDPQRTPEFEGSDEARDLVASEPFQRRISELRSGRSVDHEAAYAAKRQVLEVLAGRFFSSAPRRRDLQTFLQDEELAPDYARFRTHMERTGRPGSAWRVPREIPTDATEQYHLYAQLVAHEQLAAVAASEADAGLHLDLPIGVHREGYDTWRFDDLFASQMSVGAPPDAFFQGGQNWGFPPIVPARSTKTGHRYFIATIRKLLRSASVVRIDHVMALHRLYWIPDGMAADEGVYVRYPSDTLYAIVTLEAHRSDTAVVGEDLGTVPREVRSAMRRHGLLSTFVAQFETSDQPDAAIGRPSRRSLACVNTHDTETFAAFWERLPEARRRATVEFLSAEGFLDDERGDPIAVVGGVLRFLAASDAAVVVASLEDLWGERRPQNVPGTTSDEQPNWRRRLAVPFERFAADRAIAGILNDITTKRSEVA